MVWGRRWRKEKATFREAKVNGGEERKTVNGGRKKEGGRRRGWRKKNMKCGKS